MVKIKICGLYREEDMQYANQVRPDYAGFVFFEKSHRNVTAELAERLRGLLDKDIPAVGVFVEIEEEKIRYLTERHIIQAVQLHRLEREEDYMRLRKIVGKKVPVIQAYRIACGEDVRRAEHTLADYPLLDNGAGGSGERFDWSLLQDFSRPYFLAGGLNCGNIREALEWSRKDEKSGNLKKSMAGRLYAVDVSSGVETGRKKDLRKMREFCMAVREMEMETGK